MWDDRSLHNVDFSMFCPMFTLKEINHLEKKFLELIEYDVSVSKPLIPYILCITCYSLTPWHPLTPPCTPPVRPLQLLAP